MKCNEGAHLSTWDFQHDAHKGLSHLEIFNMKEDQGLSHLQEMEAIRRKQEVLHEDLAKFSPLSLTPCFL